MKIAALSIGNNGSTLGRKWAAVGNEVTFGARDPDVPRAQALAAGAGGNVSVATIGDAIAAEVVVFAIPGPAMDATIEANATALDGKLVIDATNKIREEELSSVLTFADRAPGAKVFRASTPWAGRTSPSQCSTSRRTCSTADPTSRTPAGPWSG